MYGTSDRKFIEMEVTIPPTQQPRSKERYINREEEAVLGATEVNSKASRMKDGGEVRGRKRGREESKGENREGTRYPPDFMAPRRRSLKVRYRQDDDVESCLVPVSIINTMKNNREKKKGRERKGDQRNVWYLVKKILCFFNNFFLSIHSITSIVGL